MKPKHSEGARMHIETTKVGLTPRVRHRNRAASLDEFMSWRAADEQATKVCACGKPALYRAYTRRGQEIGFCAAHKLSNAAVYHR